MLNYTRPEIPNGFNADDCKNAIENQINKNLDVLEFKSEFWGAFKDSFMEAQHRKCAYCESFVTSYGDVEHFRPKAAIYSLKSEGEERPYLHTVKNRKQTRLTKRGYYWLAYDWTNYLLSCEICNRQWKKNFFPIEEGRIENDNEGYPFISPTPKDNETPLLLNPFDLDIDFSEHFDFDDIGLIIPLTEKGKISTKIYGLARPSLMQFRIHIARDTRRNLIKFANAQPNSREEIEAAENLLELGHEKRNYAGMVRIIFKNRTGRNWNELENFVDNKKSNN